MKSVPPPSPHIDPQLEKGIERRRNQQAFIKRGLRSRDEARRSGVYVNADAVIAHLEARLQQAKASAAP